MQYDFTRRGLMIGGAALAGSTIAPPLLARVDPAAGLRTPYKYNKLVLEGSKVPGSFDEKAVDCPFVFRHDNRFYLSYVGFDGTGYQTGLASSDDLVSWEREGIMLARDLADPVTRYNVAAASILRENELYSPGRLIKVGGRYVCAWHAYPSAGYEQGAAVIGLAYSTDLKTWHREAPILHAQDGAEWERGGLYKPYLVKHGHTFYLFYNAKTAEKRWHEQTGVATSQATSRRGTATPATRLLRNGACGRHPMRVSPAIPFVATHRGPLG